MAIDLLPPSPSGELDHNTVRLKINETVTGLNDFEQSVADNYVIAGRGGIGVDAAVAIGTINATPQIIDGFDTEIITDTRGITQTPLSNEGLIFDVQGVWDLAIKVTLIFDELNAGRQLKLRLYNATIATPASTEFVFFVGRNTGGVNLAVTIPVEVPLSLVGDLFQLQVLSSSDSFTNTSNIGTTYSAVHVSEGQFL